MDVTSAKAKIREITNTNTTDYSDASLIRDLNQELEIIRASIITARGPMEFDDINYTNLPIGTFTVSSDGVCKITEDSGGNEIDTIHKVAYLVGTKYVDVPRVTLGETTQEALLETDAKSVPTEYYEVGQSIVFPGISGGTAKIWFERELSHLLTSDTTKALPVPYAYRNLACYRTGYNYRLDKGMDTSAIERRIAVEEAKLEQYEANRRGDEATVMTPERVIGL